MCNADQSLTIAAQQASNLMQCPLRFDQNGTHVSLLPLTFLNFSSVSTSRKEAATKATTFCKSNTGLQAATYKVSGMPAAEIDAAGTLAATMRWRVSPALNDRRRTRCAAQPHPGGAESCTDGPMLLHTDCLITGIRQAHLPQTPATQQTTWPPVVLSDRKRAGARVAEAGRCQGRIAAIQLLLQCPATRCHNCRWQHPAAVQTR